MDERDFLLPKMQTPRSSIPEDGTALHDFYRMGIASHIVGMVATMAVSPRGLVVAKNGSTPRFRESMSSEIYVECMPGNGNVDLIRTDGRGRCTKISQRDARMLVNDLVKPFQFCFRYD